MIQNQTACLHVSIYLEVEVEQLVHLNILDLAFVLVYINAELIFLNYTPILLLCISHYLTFGSNQKGQRLFLNYENGRKCHSLLAWSKMPLSLIFCSKIPLLLIFWFKMSLLLLLDPKCPFFYKYVNSFFFGYIFLIKYYFESIFFFLLKYL